MGYANRSEVSGIFFVSLIEDLSNKRIALFDVLVIIHLTLCCNRLG